MGTQQTKELRSESISEEEDEANGEKGDTGYLEGNVPSTAYSSVSISITDKKTKEEEEKTGKSGVIRVVKKKEGVDFGNTDEITSFINERVSKMETFSPLLPTLDQEISRHWGESFESDPADFKAPFVVSSPPIRDLFSSNIPQKDVSEKMIDNQSELCDRMKKCSSILLQTKERYKKDERLVREACSRSIQIEELIAEMNRLNWALKEVLKTCQRLSDLGVLDDDYQDDDDLKIPSMAKLSFNPTACRGGTYDSMLLEQHGVLPSNRDTVWKGRIGNSLGLNWGSYEAVRSQCERMKETSDPNFLKICKQIRQDVPRTFPREGFCNDTDAPLVEGLTRVVESYVTWSPIGYAQGLTHITCMLLLQTASEHDTFICLCNLLNSHFFQSLFQVDLPEINKHLALYELIFSNAEPELHKHFKKIQILPEHYILNWLSTAFCSLFGLNLNCRLWDLYLVQGEVFLYKIAVGILRLLKSRLQNQSFEDILYLLTHLTEGTLDGSTVIDTVESIDLPPFCESFVARLEGEAQ